MTEPTVVEQGGGDRRRLMLFVGLGVAALVVVLVLLKVASGGGGGEGVSSSTTQPVARTPGATTTTTTAPGSTETFEVFTTKNPFLPLRSPGGAAGAGASPAAAGTAGGTTAGGTAGTAGGTTTGGTPAGGSSGAGGSSEPRRGARVSLQDVFVEGGKVKANVRVNDTVHKVAAGEVFATNFKVVSLSQADRCGRFVFGDDPFRLCKGEQLLK